MEYRTLKDIAKITMGQSPDSSSYNKEKDGLPFFQGNADFGELYPNERIWCNEPKKVAMPGDILISVRAPIGALNYSKEKSCIGRGLAAITIKNVVERNYIFHLLRARNKYLNSKGTGSTFKAIGKNVIEEVPVPQISGEEQQKCVNVIDLIESIIIERKSQIDKLDELVRARFVEMFGGMVLNTNVWDKYQLGDLCDVRDGTHDSPQYYNEGYPLVTSKNVSGGNINLKDCNLICEDDYQKINQRSKVDYGDILMPMIGTVGNPVIVDLDPQFAIKNVALIKFRKESKVLNSFVKVLLESDYFDNSVISKVRGGTQKFISLSDIRKLEICLPPIEVQKRFEVFTNQVNKSKLLAASQPQIHIYKTLTLL